jgi:integrase
MYSFAYILGFMALLRISNIAPPTRNNFDPHRQLRRGDITITPKGLSIFIKWSKTLQKYNQTARVNIFSIPNSPLCPLQAFMALQKIYPVYPSDPLLSYRIGHHLYVISQGNLKSQLKQLLHSISLPPQITFHSFRRSGASLAFASGVPFQAIQAHGTWASEALWAYIDASARDDSVPSLFSNIFSNL